MKLIIPGEPTAKGRPRLTRTGIAYTPEKTQGYENLVKMCYMEQGNREKLTGELYMSINAYFQIPKSETKGRKLAMKNSVIRPTKRPDIDNIIKIIADSLNKLAYGDDSQIVAVAANKFYTEDNPRVEVEIIDIK